MPVRKDSGIILGGAHRQQIFDILRADDWPFAVPRVNAGASLFHGDARAQPVARSARTSDFLA